MVYVCVTSGPVTAQSPMIRGKKPMTENDVYIGIRIKWWLYKYKNKNDWYTSIRIKMMDI